MTTTPGYTLEINGEVPDLVGLRLDSLLVTEFWYKGELAEPANMIHIRAGEQWHHLYFDFACVYWREGDGSPLSFEAPEYDAEYKIVDLGKTLGLEDSEIEGCSMSTIEHGVQVALEFAGGRVIRFQSVKDISRYAVG